MNIVEDKHEFYKSMISKLKIENDEFENCIEKVKFYRDKFVAHPDDEEDMCPPHLNIVINSTKFYYSTILNNPDIGTLLSDAPQDIDDFYEACMDLAKQNYDYLRERELGAKPRRREVRRGEQPLK